MSDTGTIEGYTLCVNGEHVYVLREVARWTGGRCPDCFIAEGCVTERTVEIATRGVRVHVPITPERKRNHRRNRPKDKLAEKAKERAQRRLAMLLPDLYFQLVAEERHALGLKPWTVPMALQRGGHEGAEATLAFAAELNARYGGTRE